MPDTIRVRPITLDEARSLGPQDVVYVPDGDFREVTLVPASRRSNEPLFETEGFTARLGLRTVYMSESAYPLERVWVKDPEGEELPLMPGAGARISSALFFLGLDEEVAVERLKNALRKEFGPGVVEVWNLRTAPVRDVLWDVWEVRRDLVPVGPKPKRGKVPTEWRVVERRLLARAVRDGHQNYFMGKGTPGWSLEIVGHQPDVSATEVL